MPKRNLHFVWLGGEIRETSLLNLLSIIRKNPAYKPIIWTDHPKLLSHQFFDAITHYTDNPFLEDLSKEEFLELHSRIEFCSVDDRHKLAFPEGRIGKILEKELEVERLDYHPNYASASDLLRWITLYNHPDALNIYCDVDAWLSRDSKPFPTDFEEGLHVLNIDKVNGVRNRAGLIGNGLIFYNSGKIRKSTSSDETVKAMESEVVDLLGGGPPAVLEAAAALEEDVSAESQDSAAAVEEKAQGELDLERHLTRIANYFDPRTPVDKVRKSPGMSTLMDRHSDHQEREIQKREAPFLKKSHGSPSTTETTTGIIPERSKKIKARLLSKERDGGERILTTNGGTIITPYVNLAIGSKVNADEFYQAHSFNWRMNLKTRSERLRGELPTSLDIEALDYKKSRKPKVVAGNPSAAKMMSRSIDNLHEIF